MAIPQERQRKHTRKGGDAYKERQCKQTRKGSRTHTERQRSTPAGDKCSDLGDPAAGHVEDTVEDVRVAVVHPDLRGKGGAGQWEVEERQ